MNIHIATTVGGMLALALIGAGCAATETHRVAQPEKTTAAETAATFSGVRQRVVIGKVENKTQYQNGIFSDGKDRLGNQAAEILKTHLAQTGRFQLLDRANMPELAQESTLSGGGAAIVGGDYLLTGDVTEFGRRETGTTAVFGVLGQSKTQHAHAKVSFSLVNVRTSAVVCSFQGEGIYELSNREVLGFGSTAGYDATLNGKVLNLAVIDAVNRLTADLDAGRVKLESR